MPERRSSVSAPRKKPPARSRNPKPRRTERSLGNRLFSALALIALLVGVVLTLNWAIERGYVTVEGLIALITGEEAPPPVVTQSGDMQIYFTSPTLIYPDVARDRVPPLHEQAIIADIEAATERIDFVTFEYNLVSIAEALARAETRGVTVRLALDRESLENPVMARWAGIAEDAQIPIAWEDTDAFLHSKFIIIDQQVVWTGSWNATINDTYRNNNNLLRLTVPALVDNYSTEFEQLFAGTRSTRKEAITPNPMIDVEGIGITNYFSPQDAPEQYVVEQIARAEESVLFMAFAFTSDPTAAAMIERKQAGVRVEGVMEKRNVEGTGSEYSKLRRAGVATLEDGNCYTMHHKVIIIDKRTVITGSFNFTGRANELNVENMLIINDPAIAARYHEEFERVWQQAENPLRCG